MKVKLISRIAAYIAAVILFQTLYFKFTAHPDSVYIFSQLGMEPYGRIGIGVMELITGFLLIFPATRGIGAIVALGTISGAIFFHITQLGIVVNNDGGTLFLLAVAVFVLSLLIAWLERKHIPIVKTLFK